MNVEFVEDGAFEPLFFFEMDAVPAVGELIFYSFIPHDRDKWNRSDLTANDEISKSSYKVVAVEHFLQVRSLTLHQHRVVCYVQRTK